MANRSYPPFGKVKTIVLPIPDSPMNVDEYKQKYGIDLKELFALTNDYNIKLKDNKNALFLLSDDVCLHPILGRDGEAYEEGSNDAKLELIAEIYSGGSYGLSLTIDKDDAFKWNNVIIQYFEL